MIAHAIAIDNLIFKLETHVFQKFNSFQNGKAILPTTSEIVHFTRPRLLKKFEKHRRDISAVDLIADLFSFVPVHSIRTALDGAHHDVCQISMQLNRSMLRARQASAAKDSDRHLKVAPKLLTQYI